MESNQPNSIYTWQNDAYDPGSISSIHSTVHQHHRKSYAELAQAISPDHWQKTVLTHLILLLPAVSDFL